MFSLDGFTVCRVGRGADYTGYVIVLVTQGAARHRGLLRAHCILWPLVPEPPVWNLAEFSGHRPVKFLAAEFGGLLVLLGAWKFLKRWAPG